MKIDKDSIRYKAAEYVAFNWRVRSRLPRLTKLARSLNLMRKDDETFIKNLTYSQNNV